ncbi:MAG: hypothetical protein OXJ55_03440, partial [Caldilineaceae bacterium]|nr:hypothetical protein [Caldilineaceae bacterium]
GAEADDQDACSMHGGGHYGILPLTVIDEAIKGRSSLAVRFLVRLYHRRRAAPAEPSISLGTLVKRRHCGTDLP